MIKLDVESVAAQRSFVFLWCGSAEGLDQGRAVRRETVLENEFNAFDFAVFKKMGISTL